MSSVIEKDVTGLYLQDKDGRIENKIMMFVAGCLEENQKVLTQQGYVKIKDLKTIDFVLSYNFNKQQVEYKKSYLIPKGEDDVYKITTSKGRTIIATKNHPFFDKEGKEIDLENLKIGNEILHLFLPSLPYNKRFSEKQIFHIKEKKKQTKERKQKERFHGRFLCECGCGFQVNVPGRRFIQGHHTKLLENRKKSSERLKNKSPWNKGLTKIDLRVKKYIKNGSITQKKNYRNGKRKHWMKQLSQKERKKYISISTKNIIKFNERVKLDPSLHPNISVFGKRKYMTSIEKEIENILCSFISDKQIVYNKPLFLDCFNKVIFPDFLIDKTIIEIDGTYWHKDRRESDLKRDLLLNKNGYKVIRIQDKDLKNHYNEVVNLLKNEIS